MRDRVENIVDANTYLYYTKNLQYYDSSTLKSNNIKAP